MRAEEERMIAALDDAPEDFFEGLLKADALLSMEEDGLL